MKKSWDIVTTAGPLMSLYYFSKGVSCLPKFGGRNNQNDEVVQNGSYEKFSWHLTEFLLW